MAARIGMPASLFHEGELLTATLRGPRARSLRAEVRPVVRPLRLSAERRSAGPCLGGCRRCRPRGVQGRGTLPEFLCRPRRGEVTRNSRDAAEGAAPAVRWEGGAARVSSDRRSSARSIRRRPATRIRHRHRDKECTERRPRPDTNPSRHPGTPYPPTGEGDPAPHRPSGRRTAGGHHLTHTGFDASAAPRTRTSARTAAGLAWRVPGIDDESVPAPLAPGAVERGDRAYARVRSTCFTAGAPGPVLRPSNAAETAAALASARAARGAQWWSRHQRLLHRRRRRRHPPRVAERRRGDRPGTAPGPGGAGARWGDVAPERALELAISPISASWGVGGGWRRPAVWASCRARTV